MRVKPKIVGEKKAITYPLYVRITAKKQTTTFRSSLEQYVAVEDLEVYLKSNKKALQKEAELLRGKILEANPFDNEQFSISLALQNKQVNHFDLAKRVEELLQEEVKNALENALTPTFQRYQLEFRIGDYFSLDGNVSDYEYDPAEEAYVRVRKSYNWRGDFAFYHITTLSDLAKDGSPIIELLHKYPIPFWNFARYGLLLAYMTGEPFYTLDDWYSGRFSKAFKKVSSKIRRKVKLPSIFDSFNAESILKEFEVGFCKLRVTHPSFDAAASQYLKD